MVVIWWIMLKMLEDMQNSCHNGRSFIAMWYHPWSQHNHFIACNLAFSRPIKCSELFPLWRFTQGTILWEGVKVESPSRYSFLKMCYCGFVGITNEGITKYSKISMIIWSCRFIDTGLVYFEKKKKQVDFKQAFVI